MPSAHRRLTQRHGPVVNGRRVVLYIRYSSRLQDDNFSLDAQERILKAYCVERGWEIVAIFSDEAKSAKDDRRPGFQQMMAFIRAGKADRIVVHKLDRLSRNLRVLLAVVEELETHGLGLVCAAQPIDTSDPLTGKMILVILGVLAEMFLVALSEETIKGKRERAEQGLWLGTLPWGYSLPLDGDRHGIPLLDPAKATLLRAAADLYDPTPPRPRPDGAPEMRSWAEVTAWLNAQGARMHAPARDVESAPRGNPEGLMLKDTVSDMLQNLFYAGLIVYDDPETGEHLLFQGKHDAVTDRAQIERITAKSRQRLCLHTRPQRRTRLYVANGIARCAHCGRRLIIASDACGSRYTCSSHARPEPCPSRRRSMKVSILDREIDDFIARLTLPDAWRQDILAAATGEPATGRRQGQREDLEARLRRLHERYEVDGHLSKEAYRSRVAQLQADLEALRDIPPDETLQAGEVIASVATLWAMPDDLSHTDRATQDDATLARVNGHIAERRAFLQMAFETLTVDFERRTLATATLRPAFDALAPLLPKGVIHGPHDETLQGA